MDSGQECRLQLIPQKEAAGTKAPLDIKGSKADVSAAGDAFLAQNVPGTANPQIISTLIAPYVDSAETIAHIATLPYTIKMQCGSVPMQDAPAALPTPSQPRHEGKATANREP